MNREYHDSYPRCWAAIALGFAIHSINISPAAATPGNIPVTMAQTSNSLCPSPALSRMQTHAVTAGETLESIAAQYTLMPLTILALNPTVQGNTLAPGTQLRIPPFNGIEVTVSPGQTWQDLATLYRVRADVLFEINGCPETLPSRIFVPGVSGLLESASTPTAETTDADPLTGYPLAEPGAIVGNYGWQTHPDRDELVFSSGITLETNPGVVVRAVGAGTVAYVGEEEGLGNLIVINHAQGFQTRYAGVRNPYVSPGESVQANQTLGTPTTIGEDTASLYFEVRQNSSLGWVARDPGDFIPALAVK
jgi:murein DD-endopeptidase MepM/ murein hydrolase activator NlpD